MPDHNAYNCGYKDGDWAMLVFAKTAQEARKISFGSGWCDGSNWIEWQARKLRNLPQIYWDNHYTGDACVIDCPDPVCDACECWGGEPMGDHCSFCHEDYEEDKEDDATS